MIAETAARMNNSDGGLFSSTGKTFELGFRMLMDSDITLQSARFWGSLETSAFRMSEALLKRIAQGDKSAVQDCLKKYGGLVWSLAKRMSATTEDAEDAVQEVFIDVWKHAARFDEAQASEATFIAMIARRRLIDRLRASNRRLSPASLEDITTEPSDGFENKLHSYVEARQAVEALKNLRPEQRQVLELSIYHGLSHQEISDKTGIPLGTVKTHARRGLIQMREMLGIGGTAKEVAQ